METYAFWREREARFKELSRLDGASDLHAIRADVDVPGVLAESSEQARRAIDDPATSLLSVYGYARTAARAARIQLDGEQPDLWILGGGPRDERAQAGLHNDFKAEAIICAIGADVADSATTDQAALEVWLDLIVSTISPESSQSGVLLQPARGSAELCNQLASRAYRAGVGHAAAPAPPTEFPNRAEWLRRKMTEGRLTRYRIEVLDGPESATTSRILAGKRVHPVSLDKLATALNVSRQAIPDD